MDKKSQKNQNWFERFPRQK